MVKLKYMGNAQYIPMIPSRDLTDFDIETICQRDGMTEKELIDMLCSRGLYKPTNEFTCDICGHVSKTGKAAIKHELKHITEAQITGEESTNANSIDSIKETDTDRE